mmetsp:Transcript_10750/g.27571  ORF Transcript_10750/g.27571 Transcript_10750/m.27571 type:complete len:234 (-) Transcript_10750:2-703(-)
MFMNLASSSSDSSTTISCFSFPPLLSSLSAQTKNRSQFVPPSRCRKSSSLSKRAFRPVSSQTSRSAARPMCSPGSADPVGILKTPLPFSGPFFSTTVRSVWSDSSKITAPTPTCVNGYEGIMFGVSNSHFVMATTPGFAWWKSKPCCTAALTRWLFSDGMNSQQPLLPSFSHCRRLSLSKVANAALSTCPSSDPQSTLTPLKTSTLAWSGDALRTLSLLPDAIATESVTCNPL